MKEILPRVRNARELTPGHRVSADEAQVLCLGLTHNLGLCAGYIGDKSVCRGQVPDQGCDARDGRREHHEVRPPRLLYGRGTIYGFELGCFLEYRRLVHPDNLPARFTSGEPDRAPDKPDPGYPERAAYESAPNKRSFSCALPTVTRLQPG